jgi:hypothetical protein
MATEAIKNDVALSDELATGSQPSEEHIQELAQAGFELVINRGLLDPRYGLADEAGVVRSLVWSNGPIEGFIHRLKLLKRQAYGRAGVDFLRHRILAPSPGKAA